MSLLEVITEEDDFFLDEDMEELYETSTIDILRSLRSDWYALHWCTPDKNLAESREFRELHKFTVVEGVKGGSSYRYPHISDEYGDNRDLSLVAHFNSQNVRKQKDYIRFLRVHRWLSDQTYGMLYAPGVRYPEGEYEFQPSDIDLLRQYNFVKYRTRSEYSRMVITAPFFADAKKGYTHCAVYYTVEESSPILTVGQDAYAIISTTEGYKCMYILPSVLDVKYHDILEHHSAFSVPEHYRTARFDNFSLVRGKNEKVDSITEEGETILLIDDSFVGAPPENSDGFDFVKSSRKAITKCVSSVGAPLELMGDNTVKNTVQYLNGSTNVTLINRRGIIKQSGKVVAIDLIVLLSRLSSHEYLHSSRLLKAMAKKGVGDVRCIRRMLLYLGYLPDKEGGWKTTNEILLPTYVCPRVFDFRKNCCCRDALSTISNDTVILKRGNYRLNSVMDEVCGIWYSYKKLA